MDVAVIGLPDESAGELPMAFVVKQDGENVTEKDLQDFVASRSLFRAIMMHLY